MTEPVTCVREHSLCGHCVRAWSVNQVAEVTVGFRRAFFGTVAKSDAGFRVRLLLGSGDIIYKEAGSKVTLDVDRRNDGALEFGMRDGATWKGRVNSEAVEFSDRRRILENVKLALEFLGYDAHLVGA